MTKPIKLAFLWHMHQPYYQERVGGNFLLPWVRLHALKGYTDMPSVVSEYPGAKVTFNLTPVLLIQIEEYLKPDIKDKDDFLRLTLKPAAKLDPQEKEFILANFFMNNWDRIIKPHPRYSELLNMRGTIYRPQELPLIAKRFSPQDYLDLQVLFNLTWFGYSLKKKEPRLRELFAKQRLYTEEDKLEVIQHQFKALREVVLLYRRLEETHQIEVTTTPFYHPIMPLLYNGGHGEGYNWREDAERQLKGALEYFESHFKKRPLGIWPSEGSVSEPILSLAGELGVKWLATDEEILLHSLSGQQRRESAIYAPYFYNRGGHEVAVFFRDKKLSDLIGFSYPKSSADHAVNDFINRLREIQHLTRDQQDDVVVSVILDGENAWEHYEKDGEKFLHMLYDRLTKEPGIEMVLFGDVIKDIHHKRYLERLHTGSWINHNFQIWFGHEEDKQAWEYLSKTRAFLTQEDMSPEKRALAWEELYIAEGSDWFWWYGDEFSSSTQEIFDYLFRNHLMNVFRIADKKVPAFLLRPIKQRSASRSELHELQSSLVRPTIDGRITEFYEWAGAGRFQTAEPQGAMQKSEKWIEDIYFASDHDNLFLRVDFTKDFFKEDLKDYRCHVYLAGMREYTLEIDLMKKRGLLCELFSDDRKELAHTGVEIGFDKILEIAMPYNVIDIPVRQSVEIKVSLLKNKILAEEVPHLDLIKVTRLDAALEKSLWSI